MDADAYPKRRDESRRYGRTDGPGATVTIAAARSRPSAWGAYPAPREYPDFLLKFISPLSVNSRTDTESL